MYSVVGLRFLFGQLFFNALVTPDKAAEILKMFRNKSEAIISDENGNWAIKLQDVSCIHTFDPKEQQVQSQSPPGVPGAAPSGSPTQIAW